MMTTPNIFAALPHNAESHFRLCFYEAVGRIIRYQERLAAAGTRPLQCSFLEGYAAELRACLPNAAMPWDEALPWWQAQIHTWETTCPAHLPLRALTQHIGLDEHERAVLLLTGLVEEDIRFGSLFAALQEPLPARRPCLGLLATLTGAPGTALSQVWSVAAHLFDAGLLVAENRQAPRAEWLLRVPPPLWEAVRGQRQPRLNAACRLYPRREFLPLKRLSLPSSLHQQLCRLPAVLQQGQVSAVILRGAAQSGRRSVLGALARTMRRDLLYCDLRPQPRHNGTSHSLEHEEAWPLIGPLCTLTGAFPVIALDPGPGETVELPPLTAYHGPLGVTLRREGGAGGAALEQAITLTLPLPTAAERSSLWQRTLGTYAGTELEDIAARHLLPLGNVRRAATLATACAALERRTKVTLADTQTACRALNRQALDTLAQRLDVRGDWRQLVLNEASAAELRALERRCRHREELLAHTGRGLRGSVNRGVRALFNGPSGTGKTLAAKVLAAVLQMDIYRVDLASVVNKYIGETEKNLSQLLARAEELDVLLLIDEGDALMSNRTDVKSANDRYANLETNYLLQRLESYEGIVLVTTNAGNRIDTAFQRRFDVIVEFTAPQAEERWELWQQHLPEAHSVSPGFLREVAHACSLTGGQIRNAALFAALLALDGQQKRQIRDSDLEAALQREYRKAGAIFPLARPLAPPLAPVLSQMTASHVRNGHAHTLDDFLKELQ